ncbi:hypothetical protein P8452_15490 [Trifolium repens]|nr:hypothetical protein P8452_15490 [Trifolium repens]
MWPYMVQERQIQDIEEVAGLYEGNKVLMTTTSRKCTSPKDCPDVVHRPNYFFSMCVHGFCAELIVPN